MYDKISRDMNEFYGCSDMDASLVEDWLRDGNTNGLLSEYETELIEDLFDKYL